MKDDDSFDLNALRRDAHRAVWVLVILNIFVLLFYLIDTEFNEFVFIALFVQIGFLLLWLLPVFSYQVLVKKLDSKVAMYSALASYKNLMGQVSW